MNVTPATFIENLAKDASDTAMLDVYQDGRALEVLASDGIVFVTVDENSDSGINQTIRLSLADFRKFLNVATKLVATMEG